MLPCSRHGGYVIGEIGDLEFGIHKNLKKMYFPSNQTRLKDMSKYKF